MFMIFDPIYPFGESSVVLSYSYPLSLSAEKGEKSNVNGVLQTNGR